MNDPCTPASADLAAELRALSRATQWHCWQGVVPVLYAKRRKTSPPMVVRAATVGELRAEIERAEAGRSHP